MFNEIEMVKDYLSGKNIPKCAIDDCVFYIAKYYKELGMTKEAARLGIIEWRDKNGIYFKNINNNIDNAYKTKRKLCGDFSVKINKEDIESIDLSVDFDTAKKVALFLTVYAKIHADPDGVFSIRIATMSEWIGIKKNNIYARYLNQLTVYGFVEVVEKMTYEKYIKNNGDTRIKLRMKHKLSNDGKYIIEHNGDFLNLFNEIFH